MPCIFRVGQLSLRAKYYKVINITFCYNDGNMILLEQRGLQKHFTCKILYFRNYIMCILVAIKNQERFIAARRFVCLCFSKSLLIKYFSCSLEISSFRISFCLTHF